MAYLEEIANTPKSEVVYIDETGMDTFLYREYCWLQKGKKLVGRIPGKKYRRIGIVAARVEKQLIAPLQYDGTMNSELFELWFETRLLKELPQECLIIMDNAKFHRKIKLEAILKKNRVMHRLLFLPPYSPELNPIEHSWASLKARLRKCLYKFSSFDDAVHFVFNSI